MHVPSSPAGHAPRPVPFYRHTYVQVLFAIVVGAVLGHLEPTWGAQLKPLADARMYENKRRRSVRDQTVPLDSSPV
jgi:hypothetical protein